MYPILIDHTKVYCQYPHLTVSFPVEVGADQKPYVVCDQYTADLFGVECFPWNSHDTEESAGVLLDELCNAATSVCILHDIPDTMRV